MLDEIDEEGVAFRENLCIRSIYFVPLFLLNFGEFVVIEIVFWVHVDDLGLGGRAHDLDDLDEMIDAALADEEGHLVDHFEHDAAHGPDVDHGGVLGGSEDELRSSIAAGADVWEVGFPRFQDLGGPEVTDGRIFAFQQNIMWLDIAMADALGVYVEESAEDLIADQLDIEVSHAPFIVLLDILVQIAVVMGHDNVKVLLPIVICNVRAQNFHDELVAQHVNHLDLTVFVFAVLHHSLNRHRLSCLFQPPLEYLSESALPD